MSESQKFTLIKPIKAHGEEITELTLREPDGDDVIELGYPYLVLMQAGDSVGVDIRARVVYSYVSRLAGIPLSSAKQIKLSDMAVLQGVVMGFFGEGLALTKETSPD